MTSIGFVGLGAMGSAIARRLVDSGHPTYLHDLRQDVLARFEGTAAHLVDPRTMARECAVLMTCLPRSEDVQELVCGAGGLGGHMSAGSVLVDMTSGSPPIDHAIAADLRDGGVGFADAPVSGGPQAAAAGRLAIMVGADPEIFDRVEPVLRCISPSVTHIGGIGTGHTAKLVNNYLSALNRLAAFEAMDIAVRNGLDLRTCIDVINASSGRSYITESTIPKFLLDGTVEEQGFRLALMLKDVTLASEAGVAAGARMPLGRQAMREYQSGLRELGDGADINALASRYRFVGVERNPGEAT